MAYYPPPRDGYPQAGGFPPPGGYPQQGGYYPPTEGYYPPPPAGQGYPPPTGGYCPPQTAVGEGYYPSTAMRRPFFIVSELNGKVLDIRGGNSYSGAELIMYERKFEQSPNQLWWIDEQGCIRSMLNDFAPECRYQGDRVHMEPFRNDERQMWMFEGNRIVNKINPMEVLDIERAEMCDEAAVICYSYNGGANQHWLAEYVM